MYYFYDLIKHFNKAILRKKILQQAKLQGIPDDIALPRKLNFLDKRLSTNETSIDVSLNNDVIFHLSKAKKQIEVKKYFGKKTLGFHEIKFIFIEYNQYDKDTLIGFFSSSPTYDKNVWSISIMAMLKNGRQTKLFDTKLEKTNYVQMIDYQITDKHEEKSYLENGEKIIRLFSLYIDKKYLIINNTV